jgi:hypothetical protein
LALSFVEIGVDGEDGLGDVYAVDEVDASLVIRQSNAR